MKSKEEDMLSINNAMTRSIENLTIIISFVKKTKLHLILSTLTRFSFTPEPQSLCSSRISLKTTLQDSI